MQTCATWFGQTAEVTKMTANRLMSSAGIGHNQESPQPKTCKYETGRAWRG